MEEDVVNYGRGRWKCMLYEWNGGDERFCVWKEYKRKYERIERMKISIFSIWKRKDESV